LGIGRPDHVVSAFALGYSIFDCALPTRDARHGRLYAFRPGWGSRRPAPGDDFYRAVRIHDPEYRVLHAPVEEGCDCQVCTRYSAAYLHHLFKVGDTSAERLATLHNLRFYVRLFDLLRNPASSPPPPARGAATGQKSV
jgi:queuine tRNA-ribosyltransferase